MAKPNLLMIAPAKLSELWTTRLGYGAVNIVVHDRDGYAPESIDYVLSFRPPAGLLKTFPNLKAAFSLGAGVDGFLCDPDYPKRVPLVRFADKTLSAEMAQFVLMHVLIRHRHQRPGRDRQLHRPAPAGAGLSRLELEPRPEDSSRPEEFRRRRGAASLPRPGGYPGLPVVADAQDRRDS